MRRGTLLCTVALVGVVAAGCRGLPAHTERHTLRHGEHTRSFLVHIPPDLPAQTVVPLVLVLHGAGGTGAQMERMSAFSALADREHFIAVYPDGRRRVWNDGRHGALTSRDSVDDVGFLVALLQWVDRYRPIDHHRVYATGISNGGFMCYRLANEHAELFAAIAPVASGMSTDVHNAFAPAAPVSLYAINGTEDPLIPFNGGPVGFERARTDRGRVMGTPSTLDRWREWLGCGAEARTQTLPDADTRDRCTVTRQLWTGGAQGTAVQLDTIQGGGHTWPSGPQYFFKAVIGRVCRDYDASADIWAFFQAHGRRPPSLTPPRADH